jgi:ribonuclease III
MPDAEALQKILGVVLENNALLEQSLIHSSFINENPGFGLGHNERLEFLGDAVLDCIVAEKLYRDFPDMTEGDLTRLRAALVRRDTLAGVARNIKLGEFLALGKGEEGSGGRNKAPNLAGALEAVIGAVYLDRGLDVTAGMILHLFGDDWAQITSQGTGIDYKSKLQEVVQSRWQLTPSYRLVDETGPDHAKTFTIEVVVDGKPLGRGAGRSKKVAEMESARIALDELGRDFTG